MLTTREGGAAASAPKRAENDGEASKVGVNDLGVTPMMRLYLPDVRARLRGITT